MSSQGNSAASDGVPASVEVKLAGLRTDVDHLKIESKSWVKTWGVYLGMLGALVALPKGVLDLATQLWQRPDTSLAIREITIYHDPALSSSEVVKVPLIMMNDGNQDDVLLNQGAKLTVSGQAVELSDAEFGFFENGNKVDSSMVLPKNGTRAYDVSITFNSKTREIVAKPGQHKLDLQFIGARNKSYLATFCFPLQESQIYELFESPTFTRRTVITQCTTTD